VPSLASGRPRIGSSLSPIRAAAVTLACLAAVIGCGDEPVKVSGRVVRHEASGMGIEFDELDREARERINRLVVELRTDRA